MLTSVFNISSDYLIDEGDSEYTIYTFTVTRTRETQGGLNSVASVDFNTIDGTALAGSDYVPVSTRLTFEASSTAYRQTQTVEVMIIGDSLVEKDEDFKGVLSNNSSGTTINSSISYSNILNDDQATVSINDEKPKITITDKIAFERYQSVSLTVTLDQPVANDVTVDYTTVSQSAIEGADFRGKSGTLTFNPGEQTKTITIPLVDSDLVELDETFLVNLSHVQSGSTAVFCWRPSTRLWFPLATVVLVRSGDRLHTAASLYSVRFQRCSANYHA